MNCILVFNNINDVVYLKYDEAFVEHIQKTGAFEGFKATDENGVEEESDEVNQNKLDPNLLVQLFSPLVTSQRVMGTQFGNSYTSFQCRDGTSLVFDECMGHLFTCIGTEPVHRLQHRLGICISLARHICGPDITELKRLQSRSNLLSRLVDSWDLIQSQDQACLVEAVEQLAVNPDVLGAAIGALKDACSRLRTLSPHSVDCSKCHGLILVQNKLLALYSSREAEELLPPDIMFLNILVNSYRTQKGHNDQQKKFDTSSLQRKDTPGRNQSPSLSPIVNSQSENVEDEASSGIEYDWELIDGTEGVLRTEVILLKGKKSLTPHIVHAKVLGNGVSYILVHQASIENLSAGLEDVFSALTAFQKLFGSDAEVDTEKKIYESLEGGMKTIMECFKKNKNSIKTQVEQVLVSLQKKWDNVRKRYSECVKSGETPWLCLSSNSTFLLVTLHQLVRAIYESAQEDSINHAHVTEIMEQMQKALSEFSDFLRVKSIKNFGLGSRSLLTINRYLEEFPGLVHFIYVDRTNHRVTAPSLQFTSEETNELTKKKIWKMVEFCKVHLMEGHAAFMWKDLTFSYAYFLWFEDASGQPLKPKNSLQSVVKTLPIPGIMAGDFYKQLVKACFPKNSQSIRCFELYCVHLGLAVSSSVLEHSRRIAATVWEVSGRQ